MPNDPTKPASPIFDGEPAEPIFENKPPARAPWKGYRSAEAKKTGQMIVVIAAGVVFFAQMFIPFLMIFPKIFGAQMKAMRSMSIPTLEQSVFWQGRIWFPDRSQRGTRLRSLQLGDDDGPDSGIACRLTDPQLLASEDRLYLIATDAVGELRDGHVTRVRTGKPLIGLSRPFWYDGRPAVFEQTILRAKLRTWTGRNWKRERTLGNVFPQRRGPRNNNFGNAELQAISIGDSLHLFMKDGGTVYHREGLPPEPKPNQPGGKDQQRDKPVRAPVPNVNGWQAVGPADGPWRVTVIDGEPAIFAVQDRPATVLKIPESALTGYRYENGQWQEFSSFDVGQTADLGVCGLDQPGRFAILFSTFPGQMRVIVVQNGKTVSDHSYGRGPFDDFGSIMEMSFVANTIPLGLMLILVCVVGWAMRTYRTIEYLDGPHPTEFATLGRRGTARLIDTVIWVLPFVPMYVRMFEMFDAKTIFSSPQKMIAMMLTLLGWWAAGLAVWLVLLLIYSFTEGRWGRTPGKWLMGIRVVRTDLTYCGFWRGLARNLLLIVDAMFNFMVGLLLIALTDNRQRLGDMAAKTVVIRSLPPETV